MPLDTAILLIYPEPSSAKMTECIYCSSRRWEAPIPALGHRLQKLARSSGTVKPVKAAVCLEFGFAFFVLRVVWHRKAAASASRLLVGIQVRTAKPGSVCFCICVCTHTHVHESGQF